MLRLFPLLIFFLPAVVPTDVQAGYYCIKYDLAVQYQTELGWRKIREKEVTVTNVIEYWWHKEKDELMQTLKVYYVFDLSTGRIENLMCRS